MSPLWRHLLHSTYFWLYVGLGFVCVGAVLNSTPGLPFWIASGFLLGGLVIEYVAVRPMIKQFNLETGKEPRPPNDAGGGAGTGGPSA